MNSKIACHCEDDLANLFQNSQKINLPSKPPVGYYPIIRNISKVANQDFCSWTQLRKEGPFSKNNSDEHPLTDLELCANKSTSMTILTPQVTNSSAQSHNKNDSEETASSSSTSVTSVICVSTKGKNGLSPTSLFLLKDIGVNTSQTLLWDDDSDDESHIQVLDKTTSTTFVDDIAEIIVKADEISPDVKEIVIEVTEIIQTDLIEEFSFKDVLVETEDKNNLLEKRDKLLMEPVSFKTMNNSPSIPSSPEDIFIPPTPRDSDDCFTHNSVQIEVNFDNDVRKKAMCKISESPIFINPNKEITENSKKNLAKESSNAQLIPVFEQNHGQCDYHIKSFMSTAEVPLKVMNREKYKKIASAPSVIQEKIHSEIKIIPCNNESVQPLQQLRSSVPQKESVTKLQKLSRESKSCCYISGKDSTTSIGNISRNGVDKFPVLAAIKSFSEEMEPLRQTLHELQKKVHGLNLTEIPSLANKLNSTDTPVDGRQIIYNTDSMKSFQRRDTRRTAETTFSRRHYHSRCKTSLANISSTDSELSEDEFPLVDILRLIIEKEERKAKRRKKRTRNLNIHYGQK